MDNNISPADPPNPIIPAATLVVFREGNSGAPDILFVKRAAHMSFAGGAVVFPGGRVDPDDHAIATAGALIRGGAGDHDDQAARITAIRETLEESGIAIGFSSPPSEAWIAQTRARLATAEPFSAILSAAQLQLDLDTLIPFSRWRPNFKETRTFDTRFYLSRAPDDAPAPRVDETENTHSYWSSAADVLRGADAGDVTVIFPTRRNLERLALFRDFSAACAQAAIFPPDLICPFVEDHDGERYLCIAPGLGYPITREKLSSATRG